MMASVEGKIEGDIGVSVVGDDKRTVRLTLGILGLYKDFEFSTQEDAKKADELSTWVCKSIYALIQCGAEFGKPTEWKAGEERPKEQEGDAT